MKKERFLGVSVAILSILWPVLASAQQEELPERNDLSEPDKISLPPTEAYSLSILPPRPKNALDIKTPDECKAASGEWRIWPAPAFSNLMIDNLHWEGCYLQDKWQGRWVLAGPRKGHQPATIDTIYGYVWYNKDSAGTKEGWLIEYGKPNDFVRHMLYYHQGVKDGPEFTWDPQGSLMSVVTWKNDEYDGKYEEYMSCLPTVLGQYSAGKPVGKWEYFIEPGKISSRVYFDRKAVPSELPKDFNHVEDVYWSEWFNAEGIKIADGYSYMESPLYMGERIGKIKLYTTAGNYWRTINYDANYKIDDKPSFELCAPDDNPNAPIPSYLDYDHDAIKMICKNSDYEVYREIYFYGTGEKWKTVPLVDGEPTGTIHEYHPTGEPLATYKVKRGVPEGEVKYFTKTGELMGEPTHVINGIGKFKSWWHNGFPKEEGEYQYGEKSGIWKTWFDTGSIESEREYRNGALNGVSKNWFSNGVMSSEVHYNMGLRHGLVTGFYTDGHVGYRYHFEDGRPMDVCYDYTHAGQVSYDTHYTDKGPYLQNHYYTDGTKRSSGKVYPSFGGDNRDGIWNFYLKDGKRWYTAEYNNTAILSPASRMCSQIGGEFIIDEDNHETGCRVCAVNRANPLNMYQVREAFWEWYSENGTLEKSGSIHLGHMDGVWKYFYPNGNLMLSGEYQIDRRIGEWIGFFENGSKKFKGEYKDGVESGQWYTYHSSTGKVSSEGAFIHGKRDGEWVWFYPDGSLQEKGKFINGSETGTWTQYYPSGQKKGEGEFVEGLREGHWTWWRENGAVWRTADYIKGKEQ